MIKNKMLAAQLAQIDIEVAFDVSFEGRPNCNTYCPFHEDPASSTSKSCSVSREGLFTCKGCGAHGDAIDFYARVHNITRVQAVEQLQSGGEEEAQPVWPQRRRKHEEMQVRPLTSELVEACEKNLESRTDLLNYLLNERGLTLETIKKYHIGCDERRITIPIYDHDGSLVNIRRYLPHAKSTAKMLSFAPGYGKPRLYPYNLLQETPLSTPLCLLEGEWDTLLNLQMGFPSITTTGGVSSWDPNFTAALKDRTIYIVYDVGDKKDVGQHAAWERARTLKAVGCKVKIIVLPLGTKYIGGDITNFYNDEHFKAEDLHKLIDEAPWFEIPPHEEACLVGNTDAIKQSEAIPVTLEQASQAAYYYRKIKLRCIVAGKGIAPYLPPRKATVQFIDENEEVKEHTREFDPWDGSILSLINCSEQRLKQFIKALAGAPKDSPYKITITDTFNIEEIFLIPAIDMQDVQGPYVMRKAYYVGHGLLTNCEYELEGYTLPDPHSQAATHIITKATPADTDIDTFKLSDAEAQQLQETFGCEDVDDKFIDIAGDFSDHVTKIYGRPDLHTAIDLVFHAPLSFYFDGTLVRKGWIEALIMGDTRTGKGFVTEGLCRHYKCGEVISGENVTLAGLVGGVQKLGERWTLVWGKLPLSDRRLVVIDEAGALSQSDISRLSRIRSEGIAEVTKIISEKTTSRTRLIWLANPRPKGEDTKKQIVDYNHGIECVPEFIGASEDVARFDFALIVAHNEVPSKVINKSHVVNSQLRYTSDLCHQLLMWVWSRQTDHIVFAPEAVDLVLTMAQELARKFTPKIPLIQGEDVRFKLARIAAAAAARTFSTHDYVHVNVEARHVTFAYNFLYKIYSKSVCGYDQLSTTERERSTLRNPEEIGQVLSEAGALLPDLVDGLLESRQITIHDMCDYASMDLFQARSIISALVRARALEKAYSWYVKKPAFKDYLHQLKSRLSREEGVTMPDNDEETTED